MTEKDEIEELFKSVSGKMDVMTPSANHKLKFTEKLANQNKEKPPVVNNKTWVKPFYAIAASVTLFFCLAFSLFVANNDSKNNLANISPEMENTQNFFTMAIESHLEEINEKSSGGNKKLIEDTMKQLEKLEISYAVLQEDLIESGYDKRVISAMIKNFQKRVALLESVLEKIDNINDFKTIKNENNIL